MHHHIAVDDTVRTDVGTVSLPDPARVFASHVRTATGRISLEPNDLTTTEWIHVAEACSARKREFATGRALARLLLAGLGYHDAPIPARADGSACWPPDVVGSISHAAGVCVVAVARRDRVAGLGIDLEPAAAIEPDLRRYVCTKRELAGLARRPELPLGVAARLLFSAKEAVYKCLYPLLAVPLAYEDLEIVPDVARARFAVRFGPAVAELRSYETALRGRCRVLAEWIVTGVTLDGEPT